ncbi:efflux RND transporter periplasmic adaptor subunit [Clostridiaceae bacterium OttesenSCG-928-D20]|nr:efflux RND transporter periplasmic adaptor subunit [Clostridiaceae bacterium OttesenSCG-928-D20]
MDEKNLATDEQDFPEKKSFFSRHKRKIIILTAIVLTIIALILLWFFYLDQKNSGEAVSVEKVSVIMNSTGGVINSYSGIVESQQTVLIPLDLTKTVEKLYVREGDSINEGDPLFSYDTEEISLQIEQAKLDLDRIIEGIDSLEAQVNVLRSQRDKITSDALKLEYTQQIQSYEAQIKHEDYNKKSKELDLSRLERDLDNATVYSETNGVIRQIRSTDEIQLPSDYLNTDKAWLEDYISILEEGELQIRGTINEQNIKDIEVGGAVSIRSRLDADQIWTGIVTHIDLENPIISLENINEATKYPFYIALDSTEDLIIGQHVYIEPSLREAISGLWLREFYIMTDESEMTWVWAVNKSKDVLEKRYVSLGGYDEELLAYHIKEGLTGEDEIAWPSSFVQAGMRVKREGFIDYSVGVEAEPKESASPAETMDPELNIDDGEETISDKDGNEIPITSGD